MHFIASTWQKFRKTFSRPLKLCSGQFQSIIHRNTLVLPIFNVPRLELFIVFWVSAFEGWGFWVLRHGSFLLGFRSWGYNETN